MTIDELQAVFSALFRIGLPGVVAGLVAFALLKHAVPGYLAEKGKNLATKEDISHITHEIEQVKSQYSALLEEVKAQHQLRLAAIDRRLQAHQEAFSLWRRLMHGTHTPTNGDSVLECQSWWENNCLYLEPAAREAFFSAYSSAAIHSSLVQNRDDPKTVKTNWLKIINAGDVILKSAKLPGLTPAERTEVEQLSKTIIGGAGA